MLNDKNIPAIPVHPGEILREEFLEPAGLTQAALAKPLALPVEQIEVLCQCNVVLTAETAWLLAQAFNTSPQFWLNLQAIYELATTKQEGSIREVEEILTHGA